MPRVISQTVDIGTDAYGRQVTMTRHRTADGKTMWRIESRPVSQRDVGECMDALTDENIREMVQALDIVRRS